MSLVNAIKIAGLKAVDSTSPMQSAIGTVTSESPLEITIEQKAPIPAEFLLLTDAVRDYKAKLSFDNPDIKNKVQEYSMADVPGSSYKISFTDDTLQNEITIYNGLKLGDKVLMLRIEGGQSYVVLNRVVNA